MSEVIDEYLKGIMKEIIREAIWEGMEKATGIHARENPYAAGELLEQQQANLNILTDKAYNDIEEQVLENI